MTVCKNKNSKKLCNNDCNICHSRSFASNEKSKYWSNKNTKTPRELFKNNNKKFVFDCEKCFHEFKISLGDITQKNNWCQYCSGKKLCDDENCAMCFNNSFASYEKSQYWDKEKNSVSPREIFKSSHIKIWLICNNCKHTNKYITSNVYRSKIFCSYCSGKKLCDDENCAMCFTNSFASYEKSQYWNYKKNKCIKPRNIFKRCGTKFYFICPYCKKDYYAAPSNISIGKWCTCQRNKTEAKLFNWLINDYSDTKKTIKFDWCRSKEYNNILPFDFQISNIIIELDGRRHFNNTNCWKSDFNIQERDIYKMMKVYEKGYSIIRIYQPNVWDDKQGWKDILKMCIHKCMNIQQIIFIGEKSIYNDHFIKLENNGIYNVKCIEY